MKYKLISETGFVRILFSGDIDLHYSTDLRKLLLNTLDQETGLVLDLSEVDYLDSSGVACFVEAYQSSRKHNLKFSLSNISEPALQVLKLARLDTVFPVD